MRAIVLGGGGARGPYQIGVWRALDELGIDYRIVTGTSVGALNGALMVQGDFNLAKSMWEALTTKDVIADIPDTFDGRGMLGFLRRAVEQGGMDVTPLDDVVRRVINERKIRASSVEFGIVTTRLPEIKPMQLMRADIPEGEMADYLLASAACFPFFKQREIDGVKYMDGAYCDNLPVDLAVKIGADEIIAVDLHGLGVVHTYRHEPIPITYIDCHWSLGEMFLFDPAAACRNMRLGYHDTLRAFRQAEGASYTFLPGETAKNAHALREAFSLARKRTRVDLFRRFDRLPRIRDIKKSERFLPRAAEDTATLGKSITTAAELTAEVLNVPPDEMYSFGRFNRLILERSAFLRGDRYPAGEAEGKDDLSKRALRRLYGALRQAYEGRRLPDSFWGIAAMFQREFIAAYYVLALEAYVENL